jgi:hypothetical protein
MKMAATMHFRFREHWRALRRGRPGHRFRAHYERSRQSERCGAAERLVLVTIAVVLIAIGIVLTVIPGPAIPFFFIAGGLLASESKLVARFMDASEVLIRKIVAWGKRVWRRLPLAGRIGVAVVAVCCSAALSYLGFHLLRG